MIERHFVADLNTVALSRYGAAPPINIIGGAIMILEMGLDDLRCSFADSESPFGIGAVGRVIDVAKVDLELVAHFDPNLGALTRSGTEWIALGGWAAAALQGHGGGRVMIDPVCGLGIDAIAVA